MEKKERKYTQEFKEQMVAQYKSGTPARELVQRYGMSKSTLHKWIEITPAAAPSTLRTTGAPRKTSLSCFARR